MDASDQETDLLADLQALEGSKKARIEELEAKVSALLAEIKEVRAKLKDARAKLAAFQSENVVSAVQPAQVAGIESSEQHNRNHDQQVNDREGPDDDQVRTNEHKVRKSFELNVRRR